MGPRSGLRSGQVIYVLYRQKWTRARIEDLVETVQGQKQLKTFLIDRGLEHRITDIAHEAAQIPDSKCLGMGVICPQIS